MVRARRYHLCTFVALSQRRRSRDNIDILGFMVSRTGNTVLLMYSEPVITAGILGHLAGCHADDSLRGISIVSRPSMRAHRSGNSNECSRRATAALALPTRSHPRHSIEKARVLSTFTEEAARLSREHFQFRINEHR